MTMLIVGNLDCEATWAGVPLSPLAMRSVSVLATLLRVLSEDEGDMLWTPAPVDPRHLAEVDGLRSPRLVSGDLDSLLAPSPRVVSWATTSESARRVNHRGFALECARQLGVALPGSRLVASIDELSEHLGLPGTLRASTEWVVKAPHSAAGRWRFRGSGAAMRRRHDVRTLENLFQNFGPLVFEPWLERLDDFGTLGTVTESGLEEHGVHRQLVDGGGRFTGIELPAELEPSESALLARTRHAVADELRAAGYIGPFSIDAWRARTRDGDIVFNPLGEINARMSFGLLARTLVERLSEPGRHRLLVSRGSGVDHGITLVRPSADLPLRVVLVREESANEARRG